MPKGNKPGFAQFGDKMGIRLGFMMLEQTRARSQRFTADSLGNIFEQNRYARKRLFADVDLSSFI
ncbi:hypothetical protein D3C77_592790 [compost metagenome]